MQAKNGFAIFSGAVAVGSKGGLMAPGAVWAVTSSMSNVTGSVHDVEVPSGLLHPLCGLLHPLFMMHMRYVGCYSLYMGCYGLYA